MDDRLVDDVDRDVAREFQGGHHLAGGPRHGGAGNLRRLDGCAESRLPERVNGLAKFATRRPPYLRDLLNARFENLEGARRLYGAAELAAGRRGQRAARRCGQRGGGRSPRLVATRAALGVSRRRDSPLPLRGLTRPADRANRAEGRCWCQRSAGLGARSVGPAATPHEPNGARLYRVACGSSLPAGPASSALTSSTAARAGDEVVVLDSLEPQVHRRRAARLSDGVTFIARRRRRPRHAPRALEGVDRVVHLAAAVGVGQSMYEIDRYVRVNTMATATFLEAIAGAAASRLVVASSMSIYGEGQYDAPSTAVAPAPRPRGAAARTRVGAAVPDAPGQLRPEPHTETKPLLPTSVYAMTKRDHEELSLVVGAAYGIPTVALRFFNVYGQGQALSNPYTGVAAIFASRLLNGKPPLIFEDGGSRATSST